MRLRILAAALGLLMLAGPQDLRGQDEEFEVPDEDSTLEITDTLGADEASLRASESTFVQVIEVGGESQGRALSDVLADAVGVQIQSLGGLGQFAQVSIRGSAADQVAIFLDGVPIQRASGGAINLADYSLAQVERIEIYRGLPPPSLQGVPAGGAINIITRRPEGRTLSAALTLGSFLTRGLQGGYSQGDRDGGLSLTVDYQGSQGDFSYIDTNGTPENLEDDAPALRVNNDFNHGSAHLRVLRPLGTLDVDAFLSERGVPGIANVPNESARFSTSRIATAGTLRPWSRGELQVSGGLDVRYQGERFTDPLGTIGLGARDVLGESVSLGAVGSLTHLTSSHWVNTLSLGPRLDSYTQTDGLNPEGIPIQGRRYSLDALGASEVILKESRLRIGPQLRALGLIDRQGDVQGEGGQAQVLVSPGLGARLQPKEGIWLRGSVGRGYRPPSFFELFGDRGTVVGNPALLPERVSQVEGGGSIEGEVFESGAAFLELGAFYKDARDLIQYVQNSQQTSKAINVSQAIMYGVETRASLRGAWGDVQGSYTWLEAIDRSDIPFYEGNTLPRRPRHELFVGAGLTPLQGRPLRFTGDLTLITQTYLDQANLKPIPNRRLVSLGVETQLLEDRLALSGRLDNLLDNQVADFEGFPLPGRSAFVTLAWTPSIPQAGP